MIYQDLSLFPNLTVAENIAIHRYLPGGRFWVRKRVMRQTALDAMARVGIRIDPDKKVEKLSIADRQLVAICRAIAAEARLVIMDEPTASLTRRGRRPAAGGQRAEGGRHLRGIRQPQVG